MPCLNIVNCTNVKSFIEFYQINFRNDWWHRLLHSVNSSIKPCEKKWGSDSIKWSKPFFICWEVWLCPTLKKSYWLIQDYQNLWHFWIVGRKQHFMSNFHPTPPPTFPCRFKLLFRLGYWVDLRKTVRKWTQTLSIVP